MNQGSRGAAAFLLLALLFASHATAAALFDPALRFRVLTTDHFVIYFHQGEDPLARRLARIAEDTWTRLHEPFGFAPRRTHVVLADQSELANGYATPLPRNTIVVSASWPPGADFIGDTDDWLRLVFTHEFTHIVHLDRSEGWARWVRSALGRASWAFPNLYLPVWQIEGLATYEESIVTGSGRLHAGDFGAIVSEAARTRSLAPLDRVNGGLTAWPGGSAAYAYGLGFHQYLADRFGASTLVALADATARRVPYTTAPVFKRIYGESLGDLWRDYQAAILAATPPPPPISDPIQQLTHDGYIALAPRFDRYDRSSTGDSIVYSHRTAHDFPALNRIGAGGGAPTRIVKRYLGSTTAIGRDYLFFDEQEFRRNVGVYSDLFALSRADGHVRRLTTEARLLDPDVSPDGTTLVCVRNASGQRDLVLVKLANATEVASVTTLVSEAETQFDAPRWSPDGRTIAVERHQPGRLSEVVLVDPATRAVRVLAADARARVVTPTWRPDGRAIVAAIAFQDQPFNLYELALDGSTPPRQLTHTTGGATWPDVSADGRALAFAGYTTAGADIFTMPYPRDSASESAPPLQVDERRSAGAANASLLDLPSAPYSPFPTLRPTSWTPVIESDGDQVRAGAAVFAYDALGYHFYSASATWLVSRPSTAPTPPTSTPDWSVSYAYDRWQPTFWMAASQATSFLAGPAADDGTPSGGTLRERTVNAGVVYPMRSARRAHTASLSFIRGVDDYTLPDRIFSRGRGAIRGAWASSTAHLYSYSISPEGGVAAGTTIETDRPALGAFAPATALTVDARAYLPSFARHHVLAIRAAGGRATGDAAVRRTFHLGGPGPDSSVVDFGRSAISLLRGFPANTFAGTHVALANVDYRFPIARPERGVGTWPVFLHTVHAGLFADAGHTWTRTFRGSAMKTAVGGELSAEIVAGYFFRFTATAGIARGHDGSGAVADRTTAYFRIGKAF